MDELQELEQRIRDWESGGVYEGDSTYQRMIMRREYLLERYYNNDDEEE